MLYNDPKIIFIHVSKTGGSSVSTFLKNYEKNGELKERDNKFNNHATLQYIHDQGIDLNEYTIFMIKRNPWERIVSFYLMCYGGRGNTAFPIDWRHEFPDKRYISFPEFYNVITPKHEFNEDYFHYLEVNGKIPDHVKMLDFNNLAENTTQFCKSLGLSSPINKFPHRKENRDMTKLREYLLYDDEFIKIIAEKYKREIEYFNFKPPI